MKKYSIFILFFAFIALLSSCATTETTSFTDPDFIGQKFEKICVNAEFEDYKYKQMLEKSFVDNFREVGVYAVAAGNLLPPTREWTNEEIDKMLEKNNIDAYLSISWTDRHVDEKYTPGSVTTTTEGKTKKTKSGEKYVETSTTTADPGSVERKFYSTFYTKIISVKTAQVAWTATSQSESGEGPKGEYTYIMESLSEDIINTLAEDGHITVKEK